jgi:hypothetical protein
MKSAIKLAGIVLIVIPIGTYVLLWALLGLAWWFEFPWAYSSNWHW